MSEIVTITDISTDIEVLAGQTVAFKFYVSNNSRKLFTIHDTAPRQSGFGTTPDLSLITWFSKEPKVSNKRWPNYLNFLSVQQKVGLVVACSHVSYNETDEKIKGQTVFVETGYYYLNIQNKHGGVKTFTITET